MWDTNPFHVRQRTNGRNGPQGNPGRGAAWLARLTGGQEVAGSNPVAPILDELEPFGCFA
jgi:hypothetical protein